jgi:hypothetical protein
LATGVLIFASGWSGLVAIRWANGRAHAITPVWQSWEGVLNEIDGVLATGFVRPHEKACATV